MNAWPVVATITALALVDVAIPVGLAARGRFRRHKLVRCPIVGLGAAVLIRRAGVAEVLGSRSLRRVADCTYWPRRRACAQGCRLAPDEKIHDVRLPGE